VRGDAIRISGKREFVVNIDGEAIYTDNLSLKLMPKGLNFIFPLGMEFFNNQNEKTGENASK
jgi:hypothetical protein